METSLKGDNFKIGPKIFRFFSQKFPASHPNINSVQRIIPDYDFQIDAVFRNLAEYERFKESIKSFGIKKLMEHHIVEVIRKEEAKII